MRICKIYDFENAHIVRDCSSLRCRTSLHGHSYRCEVVLSAAAFDRAGMVYDFGLMKVWIKQVIDSFDHAVTLWAGDDEQYLADMKRHSARWVQVPHNPSAEQFCRYFFVIIDRLLGLCEMHNGERGVVLQSIKVHETATGWAECERDDAYSEALGAINLADIHFSDAVRAGWSESDFYERIVQGAPFSLPKDV